MSEHEVIDRSSHPATITSLTEDLRSLGVQPGDTVMVHSAMSRLGFVVGGAQTVVAALQGAVGPQGTLAMPTHSGHLSDPAGWGNPPVPESWWERVRNEMPAFDPALTPTREMGAVVECFRHVPGVRRSDHPTVSIGACGPHAEAIVAGHRIDDGFGESSPLARLYDLDARVLLLGVTHANNTCLHLAEHRMARPAPQVSKGSPVMMGGVRRWVVYEDLDEDADDFDQIDEAIASAGLERTGSVGSGTGRLVGVRHVVDAAVEWMDRNRRAPSRSATT